MSQGFCARFIFGCPFLMVCINVTEYRNVEEKAQIHHYLQCFRRIRSRQSRVGAYAISVEVGFGGYYIYIYACIYIYVYIYIYGLGAIHPTFRSLSQQVQRGVFYLMRVCTFHWSASHVFCNPSCIKNQRKHHSLQSW